MLEWLKRGRVETYVAQSINDFQSETAEITGAPEPAFLRAVLYVLFFMVVIAIISMSIATLERTVVAPGRVMSSAPVLLAEPLETSVVRNILVRPGDRVRKGDLLVTLDPTFSQADLTTLNKEASRLRAEIARLEAEMDDRQFEISETNDDFQLQHSIWKIRRAEYQATISRSRQLIDSAENTIKRALEDKKHFRARLSLAKDVEFMRKELERKEVGSRLNSLLASDGRVEMSRNLAEAESIIVAVKNDLEVQHAEQELFKQQWRGAVLKQLLERRSTLDQIEEALSKARMRHSRVELRAEEDAIVLSVAKVSVGAVVQAAEKLVRLVPIEGDMFVEVDIGASDQGFLIAGQEVKLKFQAYPFIRHGMGTGILRTISADSFSPADGADNDVRSKIERFYRGRVEITDIGLRQVPDDFQLVPGMTLMTNIVVGERTIMSYLLGGFMRGMADGVREP